MSPDLQRVAVVGAGPGGLAAAVTLARAGLAVEVFERNDWIGGGAATRELTLPGFRHDLASAVHPMAVASPFFRAFGLERRVELVVPDMSFTHPLPGGTGYGYRDLDLAAEAIGRDGAAYRQLLEPLVHRLDGITDLAMNPLLRLPRDPAAAAWFAARTAEAGSPLWGARFAEQTAPAMLTGCAAHAPTVHPRPAGAAGGLLLAAAAHRHGWPVPVGGSQVIVDALAEDAVAHGARIHRGTEITDLRQLDGFGAAVLDVSVGALLRLAGQRLPSGYRRRLQRFRAGPGVSKVDFALAAPVPWTDPLIGRAPTVHLGGTRAQIAAAERDVLRGRLPQHPYVLLVQPGAVDPTRAPRGSATLWAYLHVPNGSDADATETILRTIEQHAPGTRELVLASVATPANRLGARVSVNFAAGDFAAGAVTVRQLLRRPVLSPTPWRTPLPGVYLGSSATPPGPGVHGMTGWHAARTLLRDNGIAPPELA